MKKRMLCILLATFLIITPALANNAEKHWAQEGISFVTARELFQGVSNGRFAPDEQMTRAMFATVLSRMASVSPEVSSKSEFQDVDPNIWYAPSITWAKNNHFMEGINNDHFAPNMPITRVQVATILHRFLNPTEFPVSPIDISLDSYSDANLVPDWGKDSMLWAVSKGILAGKPNNLLDPFGSATRAEVATMIMRFYTSILKE